MSQADDLLGVYLGTREVEDRNRLVVAHLDWVRRAARRLHSRLSTAAIVSHDDLVSAGVVGLMQAVERFDPTLGVQFQTYATRRVSGAMVDSLRSLDWVPKSVRRRQRAGEVSPPVVRSLTADHGPDGPGEGRLEDRRGDSPDAATSRDDFWHAAVRGMPWSQRDVVLLHHRDGLGVGQVSRRLGLTVPRVIRLLSEAGAVLRRNLRPADPGVPSAPRPPAG